MKRALKFGVEIEFFGCTRERVAEALNRVGINAYVEHYNHTVRGYWKLVTDASVNSSGTGGPQGNELVSPPLYGEEGLRELELVLKVLEECGAKVDKTCGVHVHHEIRDLTAEQIKNCFKLYFKFQPTIDYLFPPSRRKEYQSETRLHPCYCKPLTEDMINRIDHCQTIDDLKRLLTDRYYTVNFCSYSKYGTLEFRQHSGSIDYTKISTWLKITNRLIEKACVGWKVNWTKDGKWRVTDSNWWFRQLVGKENEVWVVERLNYWRKKEREERERAA